MKGTSESAHPYSSQTPQVRGQCDGTPGRSQLQVSEYNPRDSQFVIRVISATVKSYGESTQVDVVGTVDGVVVSVKVGEVLGTVLGVKVGVELGKILGEVDGVVVDVKVGEGVVNPSW